MPVFGRGKKEPSFDADAAVATEATRVASSFVRWAATNFAVTVNFTDEGIGLIEGIATKIDENIRNGSASPDPKFAEVLAPPFGFYIGETYIRNHGGTWGWSDLPDGVRTVAVRTASGGLFWPVVKSLRRLLRDPGEDLDYYYRSVCLKV